MACTCHLSTRSNHDVTLSPRKVLLLAFAKLQPHVRFSLTKVHAERPRDSRRSLNKRGKNFHAKSPNEINTSRMPDGLGRLVQDMRSFFPCPRAGLSTKYTSNYIAVPWLWPKASQSYVPCHDDLDIQKLWTGSGNP